MTDIDKITIIKTSSEANAEKHYGESQNYNVCPSCKSISNMFPVERMRFAGLFFNERLWRCLCYQCHSCGTSWRSPWEIVIGKPLKKKRWQK